MLSHVCARLSVVSFACVLGLACLARAQSTSPAVTEAQLRQQQKRIEKRLHKLCHKQVCFIRGFYASDHLAYDALGRALADYPRNSWTLGAIKVQGVQVHEKSWEIDGVRAVAAPSDPRFMQDPTFIELGEPVVLRVTMTAAQVAALSRGQLTALCDRLLVTAKKVYGRGWYQSGSVVWSAGASTPELVDPRGRDILREGPPSDPGRTIYATAPAIPPCRHPVLGKRVSTESPHYSGRALAMHIGGEVSLEVTLGTDGRAHDIQIMKGLGYILDQSAIMAVRKWRFRPAQCDGKPVAVSDAIDFTFTPMERPFSPQPVNYPGNWRPTGTYVPAGRKVSQPEPALVPLPRHSRLGNETNKRGWAEIRYVIGRRGTVTGVTFARWYHAPTARNFRKWRQQALATVAHWRFRPATIDGSPVAFIAQVRLVETKR